MKQRKLFWGSIFSITCKVYRNYHIKPVARGVKVVRSPPPQTFPPKIKRKTLNYKNKKLFSGICLPVVSVVDRASIVDTHRDSLEDIWADKKYYVSVDL